MKKTWYDVQLIVTICLNAITFLTIKVGEFFSNRVYIYEAETYVIILTLLALSNTIFVLGILYSKCEVDFNEESEIDEFKIDDFNKWFENEFENDGSKGVFLRLDKLGQKLVETYLEHIGHRPNPRDIEKYYEIVRKNWLYNK